MTALRTRPLLPLALSLLVPVFACGGGSNLQAPAPERLRAPAPDSFEVEFVTSTGNWTAVFHRAWSPAGVDRIHHLVSSNFWSGARFYRVNPRVVQFGYSGTPSRDSVWRELRIPAEPVVASNDRGRISFARSGPDSRSTQLFINRIDNGWGDNEERYNYDTCCDGGYPPLGEIRKGLDAFDSINDEYGESPRQDSIGAVGNAYLARTFPRLDSIVETRVTREWR